jgi:hypothetical protein
MCLAVKCVLEGDKAHFSLKCFLHTNFLKITHSKQVSRYELDMFDTNNR